MAAKTVYATKVSVGASDIGATLFRGATVDVKHDPIDASAIADRWEKSAAGKQSWTATIEVLLDESDAGIGALLDQTTITGVPTTLALKFYSDASKYYSGNGWVTGFSKKVSPNSMVTATFTIKGDGALTESA